MISNLNYIQLSLNVHRPGKLTNGSEMSEVFDSHSLHKNNVTSSVLRRGSELKLKANGHPRYTNGESLSPDGAGGVIIVKQEDPHSPGGTSSPRNLNGGILAPADAPYGSFATLNSSHPYADSYIGNTQGQGQVNIKLSL
jgi:hypothetical protein